ncbi:MAG: LacI family DNA-binding transcriptional regulator [Steroidobacter sp.]
MTKKTAKSKDTASRTTSTTGKDEASPIAVPATVTINDVARLAGVSKKTVSRVINNSPFVMEETRNQVNAVIKQTGYSPNPQARGLAFRKSFLIGLIYDNPNAEFIVNVQDGALEALRDSGFELIVHPCDRRSPKFTADVTQFVERQKLHGAILLPPVSENTVLIKALRDQGCKVISLASVKIEGATYCAVSSDREASAEAAAHFATMGHKRIAVITGPANHRSTNERLEGFVDGLNRRGITVPPEFIVRGGYTFESGMQAAEMLLSVRNRPTAIFACNDEMAAGVYQAAYRLGITIPDKLSVIGFDDSPIALRLWPPLTTIRFPVKLMARLAATRLIRPDGSEQDQEVAFVVPHLVIRNSTQPPALA